MPIDNHFNITPLKDELITPEYVLARAWAHREYYRDILIVTIDRDGIVEMDLSNLKKLPQIAELLTKASMKYLIGEKK